MPERDGTIRDTVNYKRLDSGSAMGKCSLPRIDGILDSLGKGKVFSTWDIYLKFHQVASHHDSVAVTAFITP